MKWEEVRQAFPEQWVLIEAVQAHTDNKDERVLDEIATLKRFFKSPDAMEAYQEIHLEDTKRGLYVLHTSRKEPNIIGKKWVGVRW